MEQDHALTGPDRSQALLDIRNTFRSQRFAVLATHAEGQPYTSLVAFAVTDDLRRGAEVRPGRNRKCR